MSTSLLMIAGEGEPTNIVYNYLRQRFEIPRVLIEDTVPRKSFLERRAKRLGWRKVAGQILFRSIVVPWLNHSGRRRIEQIKEEHGLSDRRIPPLVLRRVTSVNSDSTIGLLREMDPKVVVINGTRIITERVLSATGAIFLNMHAGVTPLYRGVHGAYWALVSNDPEHCGVTVHVVDKGIDTGSIVAQAHIAPAPEDSFVTYPYLQLAAGLPLLEQAVREALGGNLRCLPAPPGESRLWSHPGIIEYLRNRISSGVK